MKSDKEAYLMGTLYLLSEGSMARKDGSRIVVEKDGEIVNRIPIRVIDSVVLQKNAQITTQAIFDLLDKHVPIFYLDGTWEIMGWMGGKSQTGTRLLLQVDCFRDREWQSAMAREVVAEKIRNQQRILRQYAHTRKEDELQRAAEELEKLWKKAGGVTDIQQMRGMEGMASRVYFQAFPKLLNQETWSWKGRSQHPAKDPVNAMLNYGYAFLAREVRMALVMVGLDERIGFFHANNGRKDSLTFDLIELFRQTVIDRFVLDLVNRKSFKPQDFEMTKQGCRLREECRPLWCARYEEYMAKPYREYDEQNSRQMLQHRVRKFADHLTEYGKVQKG